MLNDKASEAQTPPLKNVWYDFDSIDSRAFQTTSNVNTLNLKHGKYLEKKTSFIIHSLQFFPIKFDINFFVKL